ncbi:MAG: NUDIX domain-containing protein [Candidatus Schekmanbacteria bacterium]|nr:MAG: NUDIX domain-containing protein [Candidatus Schekmanbacteria bacterium]
MNVEIFGDKALPAVGGIVFQQEKVLLVKRKNPPLQGQWSIPGGRIEYGEPMKEAVKRELFEETGLLVKPLCIVETIEKINKDRNGSILFHYIIVDYLCAIEGGSLKAGSDAVDVEFVSMDKLCEKELDDKTTEIIKKAKGIKENGKFFLG